ncbi:MAG: type VI secretion system-associated protein VasI [Marinobacter sp.]
MSEICSDALMILAIKKAAVFYQRCCRWALICLFLLPAAPAYSGLVEQAQACSFESRRLQRLACFDAVFATPLAVQSTHEEPQLPQSERWRQAYAQAAGDNRDGLVYRDSGIVAGLLLTLPALGATLPRPLMVLQCHNNITELALMLPQPLGHDRVRVSINGDPSLWRLRDDGYVLGAGRGLPSIALAKTLALMPQVRLQANTSSIDGLMFDLAGFSSAIKPLRNACGW